MTRNKVHHTFSVDGLWALILELYSPSAQTLRAAKSPEEIKDILQTCFCVWWTIRIDEKLIIWSLFLTKKESSDKADEAPAKDMDEAATWKNVTFNTQDKHWEQTDD